MPRFLIPPLDEQLIDGLPGEGESLRFAFEQIELFLNTALPSVEVKVQRGAGDPEGAVTADVGTLFLRSDGGASTTLYVKEADSGANTGWVAK